MRLCRMPGRTGRAPSGAPFELRFSEEIEISYVTLRDTAFDVAGGAVRGARRLAQPSNLRWEITVEPASEADVVLALPATTNCGADGAVCTAGGRGLSRRVAATVKGPAEVEAAGFALARENSRPSGIWSDGETAWVADLDDARLYAYRHADGERQPGKDMATEPAPAGLWSDGETLWVADWREQVYAYRLSDGRRDPARDVDAGAVDTDPSGLWARDGILLSTGWEGAQVRGYRPPTCRRSLTRACWRRSGRLEASSRARR